jgi:excisionase family DNA binding protein
VDKLLLTVDEAAQKLGIGRSTLYGLIRTGKLRTVKIGRRRLISTNALTEVVETLTEETETP